MSKIILKRNTRIQELKDKIQTLRDQCGVMYRKCRDEGEFDEEKHEKLVRQIEWLKYLLWGARKGILR